MMQNITLKKALSQERIEDAKKGSSSQDQMSYHNKLNNSIDRFRQLSLSPKLTESPSIYKISKNKQEQKRSPIEIKDVTKKVVEGEIQLAELRKISKEIEGGKMSYQIKELQSELRKSLQRERDLMSEIIEMRQDINTLLASSQFHDDLKEDYKMMKQQEEIRNQEALNKVKDARKELEQFYEDLLSKQRQQIESYYNESIENLEISLKYQFEEEKKRMEELFLSQFSKKEMELVQLQDEYERKLKEKQITQNKQRITWQRIFEELHQEITVLKKDIDCYSINSPYESTSTRYNSIHSEQPQYSFTKNIS